jgi:hypothetical protein
MNKYKMLLLAGLTLSLSLGVHAAQIDDGYGGEAAAPTTITPEAAASGGGAGLIRGADVRNIVKGMKASGGFSTEGSAPLTLTFTFNATGASASLVGKDSNGNTRLSGTCTVSATANAITCPTSGVYNNFNFIVEASGVRGSFRWLPIGGVSSSSILSGTALWKN